MDERRDDGPRAARDKARHDLGNLLSIAQSSVEAMIDGVVEVTPVRLDRVREVLSQARALVDEALPRRD